MRSYTNTNGTLTYPDLRVYSKDANFITFTSDVVGNLYMIVDLRIYDPYSGEVENIQLKNSTNGRVLSVDLSFIILKSNGKTIRTEVRCYRNDEASLVLRTDFNFQCADGFSLANRIHFDDTVAYVPPISVFRRFHPGSSRQYIQFGAPNDIIIDGQFRGKGEIFNIYSDGCDSSSEVYAPFVYTAWPKENDSINGLTHVIAGRVTANEDLKDFFVGNGWIREEDVLLSQGVWETADDCICAFKMKVLENKRYKLETIQFKYYTFYRQFNPDNVFIETEDDLTTEDLIMLDYGGQTQGREYHFSVTDENGSYGYGEGDIIFRATGIDAKPHENPYNSIRFIFGGGYTMNTEPHYDYSAFTDDGFVELTCIKYGSHSANNAFNEDYNDLEWLPYGGGDGPCCLADANGVVYTARPLPKRMYAGVLRLDIYDWFEGVNRTSFTAYDTTTGQSLGNRTIHLRTTKKYNVSTTNGEYGTNHIEFINLQLERSSDSRPVVFDPQTVRGIYTDEGLKIYRFPLMKTEFGVTESVDWDGNGIYPTQYVTLIARYDIFTMTDGPIVADCDVYDQDGNQLDDYGVINTGIQTDTAFMKYCWLPFTCGTPALRQIDLQHVWLPDSIGVKNRADYSFAMSFDKLYNVDFDLGRSVVRNDLLVVPAPVYPIIQNIPDWTTIYFTIGQENALPHNLYELYDYLSTNPIMSYRYLSVNIPVLMNPCTPSDNDNFITSVGESSNYYTLTTKAGCLDNISWLRYLNHDGLERFMPVQILSTTYKTTTSQIATYLPTLSTVNAFVDRELGAFTETQTCVATDIPNEAHIEDMFMNTKVTCINETADLAFECAIDMDEITVDNRKNAADYEFDIIKKI